MPHRYFVETPIAGDQVALAGAEAHHLAHVMRAKPGEQVVLFDGSGSEFIAAIERVERASVQLAVLSRQAVDREANVHVVVGASLPKGERQRWLVEKLVELGVRRFVPLATQRGVAQPVDAALERLRRAVIEASKQCGRNRLMEIAPPAPWHDYILNGDAEERVRLVADPAARVTLAEVVREMCAPVTSGVAFAIGPEGGLTEDEIAAALAAGWRAVSLGPRILRVETAAVLMAAAVGAMDAGDTQR